MAQATRLRKLSEGHGTVHGQCIISDPPSDSVTMKFRSILQQDPMSKIVASIPLPLHHYSTTTLEFVRWKLLLEGSYPFPTCTYRTKKIPKKRSSSTQIGTFIRILSMNRLECQSSLLKMRTERFLNHASIVFYMGSPRHLDPMPLCLCASSRPVLGPTNRCRKDEVDTLGSS